MSSADLSMDLAMPEKKKARIVGVPAPAVAAVLFVLLGGAAWLVWHLVFSSAAQDSVQTMQVEEGPGRTFAGLTRGFDQGVSRRNNGDIVVRRGDVFVRATKEKSGYSIFMDFIQARRQAVSEADWKTVDLFYRVHGNGNMMRDLKVTDEQRRQLAALNPRVQLSKAENDRPVSLAAAWESSRDKPSAGAKLADAVTQIGQSKLSDVQAATKRVASDLSKILTPEQIAMAKNWSWNARPVSTQPAVEAGK